ncbi:MAG: metalloregulator ArsR/SmtB family transcription factor [Candidatus Moranbacteria bacterium]|nr:metalloregulator ArsR/SmtB family transcription factor [Candidatus Moranbacteria bacterium]
MVNNIPCCQSDPKLKEDFQKVIEFLKIINEPNRLKMLCFLHHGEQCVCNIWKNLDLPQNLASHHLKTLKDFGLIKSRQEGRKIIYWSNKEVVQKYALLLNNFLISNL